LQADAAFSKSGNKQAEEVFEGPGTEDEWKQLVNSMIAQETAWSTFLEKV